MKCTLDMVQVVNCVEIDQDGTYKYVLLRLESLQSKEQSQLLVRGSQRAGYHRDIVRLEQELLANDDCKVSTYPLRYTMHNLVVFARDLFAFDRSAIQADRVL